jgi:hypothetical protein
VRPPGVWRVLDYAACDERVKVGKHALLALVRLAAPKKAAVELVNDNARRAGVVGICAPGGGYGLLTADSSVAAVEVTAEGRL